MLPGLADFIRARMVAFGLMIPEAKFKLECLWVKNPLDYDKLVLDLEVS